MGDQNVHFKVYWIGGSLSREERKDEWVPYGAKLEQIFNGEVRTDSGYEFVWKSRCTPEQFKKIWTDPTTAGIVWFSHGDPGGSPAAYHRYRDNPWEGTPTRKEYEQALIDPEKLPQAGPNLRFAAFKSCFSAKKEHVWQDKAPDANITTHQGRLMRIESTIDVRNIDQMKMWLNRDAEDILELLPEREEPPPHPYDTGTARPRDAGPAGGGPAAPTHPDAGVPVSHGSWGEAGEAAGDFVAVSGDELSLSELLEEPAESNVGWLGAGLSDDQLSGDELSFDELLEAPDAGEPGASPRGGPLAWNPPAQPDPGIYGGQPGQYVEPVEPEEEELDVPPPDNPFFG